MGITMAFPADWRGRLARGAGWSVGILFALWVMGGVTPKAIVNETAAVIAGQLKAVFVANDMGLLATKVEKLVGLIRGVLRLLVRHEDRHVWRLHLEAGDYEAALSYCSRAVARSAAPLSDGSRLRARLRLAFL